MVINMNGYFQVEIENGKTYMKLVPPTEGGTMVERDEIHHYLTMHKIDCNHELIYEKLTMPKEQTILILDKGIPEIPEVLHITTTEDKMKVYIRLLPPSKKGTKLDFKRIMQMLEAQGLTETVNEGVIRRLLVQRVYGTNIEIASGKPVVDGEDAIIKYHFDAHIKSRPALKQDGSVDFHELNSINHCMAGDVLATMQPEVPGQAGYNVYGDVVKPKEAKKRTFKYGKDIVLSPDGLSLISNVQGHILLVDGKIMVSQVYSVQDVGPQTGNVEYDGSVEVDGNVHDGYYIHAKGNVTVKGVVQAATIRAGGSITIARGMNGKEKGELYAGGNIISKYFEHAHVEAGGYIETETVIQSDLSAGTSINVVGRKGHLMGGRASAKDKIEVKLLGSPMGVATVIELGYHPDHLNRCYELETRIEEIKEQEEMRRPILEGFRKQLQKGVKLSRDHALQCKELIDETKKMQIELTKLMQEYDQLKEELYNDRNTRDGGRAVLVHDCVHPETTIYMANYMYQVNADIRNCKFIKGVGEIIMTACD